MRYTGSRLGIVLLFALGLLSPAGIRSVSGDEEKPPVPDGDAPAGNPPAADPAADPTLDDPLNDAELVGPLKDRINKAIEKAVPWLLSKQKGDGSWGPLVPSGAIYGGGSGKAYDHPAGPTAFALYTLLKCKIPPDNAQIRKGFAWLDKRHHRPKGSYETSLALLAVCATADPNKSTGVSEANRTKIRERLSGPMRKWAQDLTDHLIKKRSAKKGWRYQIAEGTGKSTNPGHNGDEDSSSTQLSALALFAADRCGISTASNIWHDTLQFALDQMEEDGPEHPRAVHSARAQPKAGDAPIKDRARGTAYMRKSPDNDENSPYGSVTGCGLATLQIARFMLEKRGDKKWKGDEALQAKVQQAVYDSVAWIDRNWAPFSNPRHQGQHSYWLYCVERGMDLIGAKKLGKHLWYQAMADQWLGRQDPKGFWDSDSSHEPSDLIDTCWVLLFLRRSTSGAISYPDISTPSDDPPVDNRGQK